MTTGVVILFYFNYVQRRERRYVADVINVVYEVVVPFGSRRHDDGGGKGNTDAKAGLVRVEKRRNTDASRSRKTSPSYSKE